MSSVIFIINHPIIKQSYDDGDKMLTLCDGDDFDLDGDMKHIDVIHGLTASSFDSICLASPDLITGVGAVCVRSHTIVFELCSMCIMHVLYKGGVT